MNSTSSLRSQLAIDADHAVTYCDFAVNPPIIEISRLPCMAQSQLQIRTMAVAGGVWEGRGQRCRHHVCWRISGAKLDLTEACLMPGATIIGGELQLHFAANLLPPVGLCQLADDALLLSVAVHASPRGAIVYQLRFEAPHEPNQLNGAEVCRSSWFSSAPDGAPFTPVPVGTCLGVLRAAAFDAHAHQAGPRAWRCSVLLGGDSVHAVHVALAHDPATRSTGQGIEALQTEVRVRALALLNSAHASLLVWSAPLGSAAGGSCNSFYKVRRARGDCSWRHRPRWRPSGQSPRSALRA